MTLSQFFGRWLPRIPSRATAEQAYLHACVSRYDLERREREVDRGKFAGV